MMYFNYMSECLKRNQMCKCNPGLSVVDGGDSYNSVGCFSKTSFATLMADTDFGHPP